MSVVDIAIVVLVAASTLIGAMRGLARELLSLMVWLAAFVASLALGGAVAALLELDGSVGKAIGGAIIFVVVVVLGALLQRMLAKAVESTGLGGVDRMLGSLFGALRGGVLTIVVLIVARAFVDGNAWWDDSVLAPMLLAFEREALELLELARGLFSDRPGPQPAPIPDLGA